MNDREFMLLCCQLLGVASYWALPWLGSLGAMPGERSTGPGAPDRDVAVPLS